jgi:CDP-glycerol glycerophosphotransferase
MAVSDMLITDYSSCFFDYLILDRPIIHYLYDYEYYENEDRGLYYRWQEVVGGDVAFDKDKLVELIKINMDNPMKEHNLRREKREKYMTYENEDSSEIIYQEIISLLKDKKLLV